ncbi:fimbrillin family protein [uncultured Bacteroides sp.]|uniref:fimbrillin family protein n=1 Tax=uncultured Bacteroides sp. TaxID=162156 RepID=UPI00259A3AA6|nr:fimbrillin family protein [uncultured Bacteroides sp.]
MKKYFIPFLVLGTTLLYSCAKEEVTSDTDSSSSVEKVRMEFRAGIDAVSRTVLTENNKVEWEADDAISLFDSDSNNKFTTLTSGPSVTFTGTAQDNLGTYYALYPYNEKATISGSEITTTLSAEQTALEGSFAKMLNPSVAKSGSDKTLAFKNACAVVKFTLQYTGNNNITKVMFSGNGGEALAGTIHIDALSDNPSAAVETKFAETEVTLNGGFTSGSTYYFVTAPAVLSRGLTITFYDENGNEWKRIGTNGSELKAGHLLNLGTITPGEFKKVMRISSVDDLLNWAQSEDRLTTDVVLDADIDMNGQAWTPVGSSMSSNEGYSGNFDGNGKTITNLTVSGTGNVGFFGGLAQGAKVYDLKFLKATIKGDGSSYAGVVAGANFGIIDNCSVNNSEVSGSNNAGAITGNNSVQINNCNVQDVTINGNYVGGIAGVNHGKIEYCTVSGSGTTIISTGYGAGGIVGSTSEEGGVSTSGRVLKCAVNEIRISGNRVGGIAGENSFGAVAQCVVNKCSINTNNYSSGNSTCLGGVVGYNTRGDVVACYSANSIIGENSKSLEALGGIVGYNNNSSANIYGCYSTKNLLYGNVSGTESGLGAIAGYTNGSVTSCYAILPDGVSEIELVGRIGTSGKLNNCVNVGGEDFETLIDNVPDLTDDYGTTWKAAEIWEITASGATPTINVNYIGEAGTN